MTPHTWSVTCTRGDEENMDTLYSTEFSRPEGRHGSIRSDDGLLDLKLALPQALGERPARLTRRNSLPEVCGML
jgi:hypothetical protein